MNELEFLYVYGVTAASLEIPTDLTGIGDPPPPLGRITEGALQAVVSPTDELGPDPTAANTLTHQRVLSALMERGAVIPFAFGHVLPAPLISRFLQAARTEVEDLLAALAGKIEVGLKLIWKQERFLEALTTPEITAVRAQLERAGGSAASTALQARLGELLQQQADLWRAEYRRTVYEPLAAGAVAAKLSDPIGPRMALNAAFLVDRVGEGAFDRLVDQICQPLLESMEVRYTGPWPPYSFVTMRVRLEGDP